MVYIHSDSATQLILKMLEICILTGEEVEGELNKSGDRYRVCYGDLTAALRDANDEDKQIEEYKKRELKKGIDHGK